MGQIALWWRGRIGRLEDKIHTALSAAAGIRVTTADLLRWVYFGARWDMHAEGLRSQFRIHTTGRRNGHH